MNAVDLSKEIVMFLNVQKGFYDENTKKYFYKIEELLLNARLENVLATKFVVLPNLPQYGSYKAKTIEEQKLPKWFAPYLRAVTFKFGYNCADSLLVRQLQAMNNGETPKKVYLAGFNTESFILMTAMGMADIGIQPVILEDYCFSQKGEVVHNAAITILKSLYGDEGVVSIELFK